MAAKFCRVSRSIWPTFFPPENRSLRTTFAPDILLVWKLLSTFKSALKAKTMNYPNQNPNGPYNGAADPFSGGSQAQSVAQASAEAQLDFIRKTYVFFLAGILCALVVGTMTLQIGSLQVLSQTLWNSSPLIVLALLLGGSFGAQAISRVEGLNLIGLFGFTALIGFLFGPILAMYDRSAPGIVSQAAVMSAVVFGSLTAYVFVTRKNFQFIGGFLFVGMVSLIVGSVINMLWLKNWDFSYWLAWGSLVISSGFVLYTTSNMLHEYRSNEYVSAALSLFISFFNIFMSILRILAGRR